MLVLLSLAAARATHLVADDSAPFGYLRDWLQRPQYVKPNGPWSRGDRLKMWLGEGMDCTFCVSIHAGFWSAVLATYANWILVEDWYDWPTFMVVWFAIAAVVVLLESLAIFLMGSDD